MKRSRTLPHPPNNYIILVLDSCRYDSFLAARPKTMRKLGRLERRWSYASWTAPSHYNLLMGLMPHSSPRRILSSEYYRQEFLKFNQRLGLKTLEYKSFVPRLYLPVLLQHLGFRTHAKRCSSARSTTCATVSWLAYSTPPIACSTCSFATAR